MSPIRASILIDQPIERVFHETTRQENFVRWNPDIIEPRWISGKPNEVGARFEAKLRGFWGRQHPVLYEVIEFEPPRRHSVRLMSPPFCFKGVIELEAAGASTLLKNSIEPDWDFPAIAAAMTVATPLLYFPMRMAMMKILTKMKRDIESGTDT